MYNNGGYKKMELTDSQKLTLPNGTVIPSLVHITFLMPTLLTFGNGFAFQKERFSTSDVMKYLSDFDVRIMID